MFILCYTNPSLLACSFFDMKMLGYILKGESDLKIRKRSFCAEFVADVVAVSWVSSLCLLYLFFYGLALCYYNSLWSLVYGVSRDFRLFGLPPNYTLGDVL